MLPKSQTIGTVPAAEHDAASGPNRSLRTRPPDGAWNVTTTWFSVWLSMFWTWTGATLTPLTVTAESCNTPLVAGLAVGSDPTNRSRVSAAPADPANTCSATSDPIASVVARRPKRALTELPPLSGVAPEIHPPARGPSAVARPIVHEPEHPCGTKV